MKVPLFVVQIKALQKTKTSVTVKSNRQVIIGIRHFRSNRQDILNSIVNKYLETTMRTSSILHLNYSPQFYNLVPNTER